MLVINKITVPGYKMVLEGVDSNAGFHCFIAIHDITLGPALGGTRIYPYASTEAALQDVLRLSKAMTYKAAVAKTGTGGGKSVIIASPSKDKTPALFTAFAEMVNSLNGEYYAAEDIGSTIEDIMFIRQKTPYVCASEAEGSSGEPSRFTAWGVFRGIQAVSQKIWNTSSVKGRTIAVQGLGNVGAKLADILFWHGANLILTDIDENKLHHLCQIYGAKQMHPEEIYAAECDIFAPCALGGILNDKTIPQLNCKAVAGGANNQLLQDQNGEQLAQRGILYAPDFVINAGGVINAACELEENGYDPIVSRDRVEQIYDSMLSIFSHHEVEKKSTHVIANELAEHNLKFGIGKKPDWNRGGG
jgi:leucine dehydrogenase